MACGSGRRDGRVRGIGRARGPNNGGLMSNKRRSKQTWSSGTGALDARLSGLTARQSQRVRDLARRALAERGLEAVVYADHLRIADGRVFGLDTLASLCHNAPLGEAGWPQVVAQYLNDFLTRFPQEPPQLTAEQLREGTHLRLVLAEALPADWVSSYTYARPVGGGLLELLAHKDGDYVRWLRDEDVKLVGHEELVTVGLTNLLAVRPDNVDVLSHEHGRIYCLDGASGFIASKALVLPEVLRELPELTVTPEHGVLVSMPTRHSLAIAPVDNQVVWQLASMMSLAAQHFSHGIAPLAPHVFWWCQGTLYRLTDVDRTGLLEPALPEEFLAVTEALWAGSSDAA